MHRTQLLIEQWQYEALRLRAERRSVSISELVREILAKHLENKEPSELYKIEGIGSDGSGVAREHDAFLYGQKMKKRRR